MNATFAVLERNLRMYRREWRISLSGSFLLPMLFLVSFGIGVGRRIGRIDGTGYLSWMVPGLLASIAFQMAFSGSTYPVFNDVRVGRVYHAMAATPMRAGHMVGGWLLYSVLRVQLATLVFLGVTWLFHGLHSPWALAVPLVSALLTFATAASCMAFSAGIETEDHLQYLFRLVMIPATLFCGVYFPVDRLGLPVRLVVYAMPLWHGVELDRAATLGVAPAWPIPVHVAYLVLWCWLGWLYALRVLRSRLMA